MVDFILLVFVVCVFAAGFWAGKTFLTYGAAAARAKAWCKAQIERI